MGNERNYILSNYDNETDVGNSFDNATSNKMNSNIDNDIINIKIP